MLDAKINPPSLCQFVSGSDYDFINEESHKEQEGVEPAPDGMISHAEWCAIWAKTDLYGLRDMVTRYLFRDFI